MTKRYDVTDNVNKILKLYDEMESEKHGYKNWYDFTGVSNFEKAYLDAEKVQEYLRRALTFINVEDPTQFGPVNVLIGIVLSVMINVPMLFYLFRLVAHGYIGCKKYTKRKKH